MKLCILLLCLVSVTLITSVKNPRIVINKKSDRHTLKHKNSTQQTDVLPKEDERIFISENGTSKTFQLGSTADLHCHFANNTAQFNVTWTKLSSSGPIPLTRNLAILDSDKRFLPVLHANNTNHWVLRIRYTNISDAGPYQCSTEGDPNTKLIVNLTLIRAHAVIRGDRFRKVYEGNPLRLTCLLRNSIEPPLYIFWYKDDRVINYDLGNDFTVRKGRQGSELIFPATKRTQHAGNYSCVPSNADQANVIVDVL